MGAIYTRLKTGSWGVFVTDKPEVGQKVAVEKKNGEVRYEQIAEVLLQERKGWVCSIQRQNTTAHVCANCGGHVAGSGVWRTDSNGLRGRVCLPCSYQGSWALSFA